MTNASNADIILGIARGRSPGRPGLDAHHPPLVTVGEDGAEDRFVSYNLGPDEPHPELTQSSLPQVAIGEATTDYQGMSDPLRTAREMRLPEGEAPPAKREKGAPGCQPTA